MVKYFIFLLLLTLVSCSTESSSCYMCEQIISYVQTKIANNINLNEIYDTLDSTCEFFEVSTFCDAYLMPHVEDIFWGLRSHQTPSMVCQRLNLCIFTITSITGTIFFALDKNIYNTTTIVQRNQTRVSVSLLDTITKNPLSGGIPIGLSCSTKYCLFMQKGPDYTRGGWKYSLSLFGNDPVTGAITNLYTDIYNNTGGPFYGPWYDFNTDEFWIAQGNVNNMTFGLYDPQYRQFSPKSTLTFHLPSSSTLLSATVIDRILYFTFTNDNHLCAYDLALRLYKGNYTTPKNTMLAANPVTKSLYGYSNPGVWKYNKDWSTTTIVNYPDFSSILPIASADVDPTINQLWISATLSNSKVLWFIINLNDAADEHLEVTSPPGAVIFGFNPETVKTVEN